MGTLRFFLPGIRPSFPPPVTVGHGDGWASLDVNVKFQTNWVKFQTNWVFLQTYKPSVQSLEWLIKQAGETSGQFSQTNVQLSWASSAAALKGHLFPWKKVCLTLIDWTGCARQTQAMTQPQGVEMQENAAESGSLALTSPAAPDDHESSARHPPKGLIPIAWSSSSMGYKHGLQRVHNAPSKHVALGKTLPFLSDPPFN